MIVNVAYQMVASIEADTIEECQKIWEDTNIELQQGNIVTEYAELLEVYDEYGVEINWHTEPWSKEQ